MNIVFLGLGTMGLPMANNLLKAGYSIRVWNRSTLPAAKLAGLSSCVVTTPQEAAKGADVVVSMLSDDTVTRDVLLNQHVLTTLEQGAIHINMATVSVALAEELESLHRERGISYIAAPVLGRVNVAEAGQLNILAAGDAATLAKIQPLFDVLGQKTWHCGARPAQANATKLAVNFMIASAIGTMGEAVSLAQGQGVDKTQFLELITSTLFNAPVYKSYGEAIAKEHFEPAGFKMSLGLKDVRLALDAAEKSNVPMPLASVLRDAFIEALAHDEGHLDWAALSRTSLRRAGQIK